jgi:hypothetical protein
MRFLLVALDRRGLFRIQEEKDGRVNKEWQNQQMY